MLREFLYVDLNKVRGLLGQIDDGVVESETHKTSIIKNTGGGVKGVLAHSQDWTDETASQKSLGDALFPTLEAALDSMQVLTDISDVLVDPDYWTTELQRSYPAGSLVRITGPGHLFDSRYVAQTFSNLTAAAAGLQNLGVMDVLETPPVPSPPLPPKAKPKGGAVPTADKIKRPRRAVAAEWGELPLEGRIPDDFSALDGSITSGLLHGLIQVSRGVFTPGLNLHLQPSSDHNCVVQIRLEEGRSFLDSEPDVLFARYGVVDQEWTVVGTIGHHGPARMDEMADGNFVDAESGDIQRSQFSRYVNQFMQFVSQGGFADLVQSPAFSIVPIAVYRTLNPRQISAELARAD